MMEEMYKTPLSVVIYSKFLLSEPVRNIQLSDSTLIGFKIRFTPSFILLDATCGHLEEQSKWLKDDGVRKNVEGRKSKTATSSWHGEQSRRGDCKGNTDEQKVRIMCSLLRSWTEQRKEHVTNPVCCKASVLLSVQLLIDANGFSILLCNEFSI